MTRRFQTQAMSVSSTHESPLRYFSAGGIIGVPTLSHHLRTLVGGTFLLTVPPILARYVARRGQRSVLHAIERWWAHQIRKHLAIRLELTGLEHIAPDTSYVVTPLHEGFADVPALAHLPLSLRFAARDELFTWRILGPYLHDTGQIYVAPERGRWSYRHLLQQAQGVFDAGESLVIFPQGTILGIETAFLPGAFALARTMQRPILPIALTGSHRVWEHPYTPRLRYNQRISLRVLPPLSVDDIRSGTVEELRVEVQRQVKAAALDGTIAPPRHFVPARDGYWDGFAYRIDPDFPDLAADVARHRELIAQQIAHPTPVESIPA